MRGNVWRLAVQPQCPGKLVPSEQSDMTTRCYRAHKKNLGRSTRIPRVDSHVLPCRLTCAVHEGVPTKKGRDLVRSEEKAEE